MTKSDDLIKLGAKYIDDKDFIMAARVFRLLADECDKQETLKQNEENE